MIRRPAPSPRTSQLRLYPTRHYPPVGAATRRAAAGRGPAAAGARRRAKAGAGSRGNGVRIAQGYKALQKLAETAGLPVATTAAGKGVFAETHPLALGVFGPLGTAAANACVAEIRSRRGRRLEIEPERHRLGKSRASRPDPAKLYPNRHRAAQRIVELPGRAPLDRRCRDRAEPARRGPGRGGPRQAAAERRVAAHRERHGYFNDPAYFADEAPNAAAARNRRIAARLARRCDRHLRRWRKPHHDDAFLSDQARRGIFAGGGFPPTAFGIPAALGAKLVHPGLLVVAVCGDGGFAMTMNGLITAVEQDIPITVVVFNNNALGWVLHGARPVCRRRLRDWDHAAIARAMGCRGVRVEDPAAPGPALRAAPSAAREPCVIDVRTSLKTTFADVAAARQGHASPRRR